MHIPVGLTNPTDGADPTYPNERAPYYAFLCTIIGLWSGFLIGWFTEYMTSHTYHPVRELAGSCKTGAGTNVIYGLALGYYSTVIPAVLIAIICFTA